VKHFTTIVLIITQLQLGAQNFSAFPDDIIVQNTMSASLADYLERPSKQVFKSSIYVKQRTGLFKEIRSSQLNVQYSLKHSNLALQATTNQKGKYINRNRIYGSYAHHLKIAPNKYIAGSLSVGLVNYSISSNSGGPSGSDMAADASIGLAYYDKKNTINLTLNQLPQPTLSPFYEDMTLVRYAQVLVLHNYGTLKRVSGHVYGRVDVYADSYKQYSIGNKLVVKDRMSLGLSANSDGNIFAGIGAKTNPTNNNILETYLGYQTQTSLLENRYNVSSFQLGIIYYRKK